MATKSRIAAAEALRDLRSGLDDSALMQKYGLSPKGLQSLIRQLIDRGCITQAEVEQRMPAGEASVCAGPTASPGAPRRLMNPAEFIRDLRAGMHDFDLMDKYQLGTQALERVLGDLARSGLLEQSELDRRRPGFDQGTGVRAQGKSAKGEDQGPYTEEVLDLIWECPVCGIYQSRSYAKCPECGALVALLTRKHPS